MITELVAFYEARLAEQEERQRWLRPMMRIIQRNDQQHAAISPLVELAKQDIADDWKLIARYKAAVESHDEALQVLVKASQTNGNIDAAYAGVAAANAREKAFLAILEDRAGRFADHEDYQEQWRTV